MSLIRWSDYGRKKETVHKTKLPTTLKSTKVYCRNCNAQNIRTAKTCAKCGIIVKSWMRRPYR